MASGRRTTRSERLDAMEILASWAGLVFRICFVVVVIAYGYYVWAIAGGYLTRQVDARILSNLRLMGTALVIAGGLGTASLLVVTLDEVAWAVLTAMVGAGMLFGTPALIASYARGGQTQSVQIVGSYSAWAGEVIIALSVVRILYEIVLYIRLGPPKPREELAGEKFKKKGITASLWARCWDMPYCHEAVREMCPAYRARKTCWKFGYGCMCNPKLIEALIRASTQGQDSTTKLRQAEYVRSDLEADMVISPSQRTIPCSKCAIFVEHQRQKFRIVNPIVAIGTVAAMALGYKPLMAVYTAFVRALSKIAARFTLSDQVDPSRWFAYLDSPTVRIFFFVIFGTLLLAYILKALEWLILTKKIL